MHLPDVNILIGAHRTEHPHHAELREWLADLVNGDASFGMSGLVLAGFLRIVTNPRALRDPTPMSTALVFVDAIVGCPTLVPIEPGPRHLEIFLRLCREPGVRAGLVPDAYFAALAMESGCRWVTQDRDFARFPGLDWFDPVAATGG